MVGLLEHDQKVLRPLGMRTHGGDVLHGGDCGVGLQARGLNLLQCHGARAEQLPGQARCSREEGRDRQIRLSSFPRVPAEAGGSGERPWGFLVASSSSFTPCWRDQGMVAGSGC